MRQYNVDYRGVGVLRFFIQVQQGATAGCEVGLGSEGASGSRGTFISLGRITLDRPPGRLRTLLDGAVCSAAEQATETR